MCLASPDTDDFLTAEPAVVIPREGEEGKGSSTIAFEPMDDIANVEITGSANRKAQHGATFRRSANVCLNSHNNRCNEQSSSRQQSERQLMETPAFPVANNVAPSPLSNGKNVAATSSSAAMIRNLAMGSFSATTGNTSSVKLD